MPCPHSGAHGDIRRFFRRDVIKATLAAGGVTALAACIDEDGLPDVEQGVADVSALPYRQFAWNDYLGRDDHDNTVFPYHQLILFFRYTGSNPPTTEERDRVSDAFYTLDRAFQRGNGGVDPYSPGGLNMPGVLYTMGYSRRYFDRFDQDLHGSVDLFEPETLLERLDEDPEKGDDHDAALVLTSDHAQVLLASELALFGRLETLNGLEVEGTLAGVFEITERRTGFVGPSVPRRELGNDDIPVRSPLAMGFVSGFADNQATESAVSIEEGPFADGTLQQISALSLDLDEWYDLDSQDRIELMFSPDHTADDVGEVGEFLARDSGLTEEMEERLPAHAREEGRVGHTQKLAAARNEDFDPLLLRRSEAVSTGDSLPGFNFTSLQRDLEDFIKVRQAMDGEFLDEEVDEEENGIIHYHSVERRGAYLVPPRPLVALPAPDPEIS